MLPLTCFCVNLLTTFPFSWIISVSLVRLVSAIWSTQSSHGCFSYSAISIYANGNNVTFPKLIKSFVTDNTYIHTCIHTRTHIHTYTHTCVHMYIRIYTCIYVCMHACMYGMYVCMHICMDVCFVCLCVFLYVYMLFAVCSSLCRLFRPIRLYVQV